MGMRSVLVAILGIAVAGGSAYGAREYLTELKQNAAAETQPGLVSVVIAGRDIPFGNAIQPQMLQVISWPSAALPPGAVTTLATLVADPGDPMRRAKRTISQGELILLSKISEFGEKVTIVQGLGANLRAMAVKVDAETAVGGFVTPGDRVDVILTQGRDETLRAVTILQNLRVIAVDQDFDENTDQPEVARTVTLEVNPASGQKLALAQKAGTLSLSLRTLDGAVDEPLESIRLSDLLREVSPIEEEISANTVLIRRAIETEVVEVN
ncbi:MAG: Flp pilus assembly protein CpaB [Paracoccaceae bacterium]